jgi:energy-converting hydrogenase Eha subunit C
VLLALVGGAWLRWLLGASTALPGGAGPVDRVASVLLLGVGAVVVVQPWSRASIAAVAAAAGLCVLLLFVGLLIRNATVWFEQMTSIPLTAGLAAGFAALAALPFLARLGDVGSVALIVGVSAALLVATAPLRRVRIPAIALHVDDRLADIDALGVSLVVRAHLTTVPHAFALLIAWAVGCLLVDGGALVRSLSAGAAYLAVLALWDARSPARRPTRRTGISRCVSGSRRTSRHRHMRRSTMRCKRPIGVCY